MIDLIKSAIDVFLHIDKHLHEIILAYGAWTYLLLFVIVFCETGLVVTPFLPGDSLLFAAGTFAAKGSFNPELLVILISIAAIIGDTVNFWVGAYIGPKVFSAETSRFLNRKHLERTHRFYERHGGKTIFIARFMPILRTFAPFVAGIGKMPYVRFLAYSISGTICWIGTFVLGGYFFGNLPTVKRNFHFVVVAIVVISVMPAIIGYFRERRRAG